LILCNGKVFYELYPALYVLAGIAAISLVDTLVAFLSGVLLVISGVAILFLRRNYRATKDQLIHTT